MNASGWLLMLSIAIVVLLFSLLRKRGGPSKYPEVVQYILYDIKLNQALVDTFQQRIKPRRFENVNWQMNKTKISFLGESLKEALKETFSLVDEFNKQIQAAKKARTESYKSLDLTHFKDLLTKCRQELEDWMVSTTGQKELPPKYPSLSSFFFGER